MDGFGGTIISIGPFTDKVLKKFDLPDTLIPRLRVLTQRHKDSDWQFVLRSLEWGFTYEQVVNIAEAMKHDITLKPGFKVIQVSLFHLFLSRCS